MQRPETPRRPRSGAIYLAVFLAFFYFQPILEPKTTKREWLVTIAATVVFLFLYFGLFWSKRPWNYLIVALMVAMGLALGRTNQGASIFINYASMFLAW